MQSETIGGDTKLKPHGGFVDIATFTLGLLWWAYSRGLISLRAVRVGLALFELRIRRRAYIWTARKRGNGTPDFVPRYSTDELAELCGLPEKRAKAALKEILELGIVAEFSDAAILFTPSLKHLALSH